MDKVGQPGIFISTACQLQNQENDYPYKQKAPHQKTYTPAFKFTLALEKTPANEKTVEGARARLEQAKKELEDLEFLKEALTRKNPEIQAELMSAQRDLAQLETLKLCAMTPDLIDAYNSSLRQNFDFLCKLKIIIDAVGERCGLPQLRKINEHLGLALRQLPENLTLCEFKGRMGGVDMQVLSYGKIDKKALLQDLLN